MDAQREGWLNHEYVRIYASSDRARIAALYGFDSLLPGFEPWGSWGLDALCLGPDGRLQTIPWIPLAEAHGQMRYESVAEFTEALAGLREATPSYEHYGKELHFIKPIIFGGDPNDQHNIAIIDQDEHAKICQFWNGTYFRIHQSKS